MIKNPPNWTDVLKNKIAEIPKLLIKPEVSKFIEAVNNKYYHWEKFKHLDRPQGVDAKTGWSLIKMSRMGARRNLSMLTAKGTLLHFSILPTHNEILSYIDRYASGTIMTLDALPDEDQRAKYVISGLIEEAISSSQMEGAATTRVVAKEMLETERQPKNHDEQMILNNYKAMRFIENALDRKLNDTFILELHEILTVGTLDKSECGNFRKDADDIVVQDKMTGEISHYPPSIGVVRGELKKLYKFANKPHQPYIHPLVAASIIHFQIGHLHPFTDGNGRLARALFLWFAIKRGYWLFKFVPISPVIKRSKISYTRAFEYVESDEGDITYFLSYQLDVCKKAIAEFIDYSKRKQKEKQKLQEELFKNSSLNERQLDLIQRFRKQPNIEFDLGTYKKVFQVVYETARKDMFSLVDMQILKTEKRGKKYVFSAGPNL